MTVRGSAPIDVPVKRIAGDELTLGIRPEHVELVAPGQGTVTGDVLVAERLGGETFLHVDLGAEEPLVVRADGGVMQKPGETVGLRFLPAALHLFGGKGQAFEHRERHGLIA